jgi:hypothetical protein
MEPAFLVTMDLLSGVIPAVSLEESILTVTYLLEPFAQLALMDITLSTVFAT